jgi:2-polyprenyl-6-methoxyphenol hydroxylase-like FAD-dependent oxidoreductase
MAPLKVLICGAGITGNTLAFWLSKVGHDITVVERFPDLRATGLQVDLRGPGIQVTEKNGHRGYIPQILRRRARYEAR